MQMELYLAKVFSNPGIYLNLKHNIADFIRSHSPEPINNDSFTMLNLWEGSIYKSCVVCLEEIEG